MYSQPQPRVLVELRLTSLSIICDLRGKQLTIALDFRRCCVSVDDRLHDSSRAENGGWSKCKNVLRCATLGFVGFRDSSAAGFELADVVFENRIGDRNQSGHVIVTRA